jgi:hypothetical protein
MTAVRRAGVALAVPLLTLALVVVCGPVARHTILGPDSNRIVDEQTEIDHQRERLNRDIELSEHLVTRLATGTISLADATEQMEPRLQQRPGFQITCENNYRVPNTRLGTARYLIQKVEWCLEADPTQWAAASARLEAEYAALK